jgi:uncharacterized protein YdhG (YjbR/CyaY superfamily)
MAVKSKSKPATIDDYLAALPPPQRAAMEKLRTTIRAAAPKAEECISYSLPAFRLDGRMLVGFGATAKHCALYLMSASADASAANLAKYDVSKGTVRFQPDKPLPAVLVRKLVKARIAENAALKAAKPRKATPAATRSDPAVAAFLRELDHPRKKQLEALRKLILGVSPRISEGIKWNSPSFRTTEYFATVNTHGKDSLRLILHTGAKVRDTAVKGLKVADPSGVLKWLAKDRALVSIGDDKDLKAKSAALKAILRAWIAHV